jgi:hypothetical protein
MHLLSFKQTALFKRGVWLSAAALLVFVLSPLLRNEHGWGNPLPEIVAACLMLAFFGHWLRLTRIHLLADEVIDCGRHLQIRRGRTLLLLPLSNIAMAEVSTHSGLHRITVHLLERSVIGARIELLPPASLWSNLPAVQHLALSLTDRAKQAQSSDGSAADSANSPLSRRDRRDE